MTEQKGRKMSRDQAPGKVIVVTDGTSSLTLEMGKEYGVHVVPLYVMFGTDTYRDGVDLDAASLRGPASTWTYLEEDVFKDPIAAALLSQRNIGFAVSAAMVGPLLMLWALVQRFQKRQR